MRHNRRVRVTTITFGSSALGPTALLYKKHSSQDNIPTSQMISIFHGEKIINSFLYPRVKVKERNSISTK